MRSEELQVKAATDPRFRAALIGDPKAALRDVGVDVPDEVEIVVVESTPDHLRLSIPPALPDDVDLDEEALAGVAGGTPPAILITGALGFGSGFGAAKLIKWLGD